MSEEERKGKVKVSRLAVASLLLMMPALLYCLIAPIFPPKDIRDVPMSIIILYSSMFLAGLVIALISILQIKKSNGILVGKLFAGLSIAIFILLLLSLLWSALIRGPHP